MAASFPYNSSVFCESISVDNAWYVRRRRGRGRGDKERGIKRGTKYFAGGWEKSMMAYVVAGIQTISRCILRVGRRKKKKRKRKGKRKKRVTKRDIQEQEKI